MPSARTAASGAMVKDGERGDLLHGSTVRSRGKSGAHTHGQPRGRRGNPGPPCLRRGCPSRRLEEDCKYR